jgi:alkanesulfonate monooxygenase SsuD/methylene tetrahydromethanopterin reductase-like flavin-dependent oxidoreductase (luciferase family)
MPERFFLGVGTGENLNEHILGDRWPQWDVRADMLTEAVEVIRDLWSGQVVSHDGAYYTVENARLYTLPETPPTTRYGGWKMR